MGKIDTHSPPAGSTFGQFLLAPERQLTLEGRSEPLLAPSPAPERAPEARLGGQNGLFDGFQLPLPLATIHKPVDGKVAPECNEGRGFHASTCPEHPEQKPKVHPHVCGVQKCESSREANTKERARDAWNGTADKGERVGLKNLSVPWGIFVWTLPEALRGACVGARLRKFRRAAQEMTEEVLQRNGAGDAEFYGRSWLHPVGDAELPELDDQNGAVRQDGDGITYKPHENVLVPLVHFRGERVHRLKPQLPKSWMGDEGWVQERWREKLVGVFGQWWPTGAAAPTVNWFYEYRERVEHKKHALRYFARVFPNWAGHSDVSCRPRAWGLAHWKKKEVLLQLVEQLETDGEFSSCPHSTKEAPCPPALSVGAKTEAATVEALELLVEQYRHPDTSYLETRRIMLAELERRRSLYAQGPPSCADPPPELAI